MSKLLRFVWPAFVVSLGLGYVAFSAQARDDAATRLLGSWRVLAYEFEFQDGGERARPLGTSPNGYIILGSDGRMMAYLEASGRTPPRNDQERADAYKTMNAYTGRYRVEGGQWFTKVDGAWNVEWVGAEQARSFVLAGDRLTVTGQWNANPLYGGRIARGHLTFEREK
jgi:lipocalin-like protein